MKWKLLIITMIFFLVSSIAIAIVGHNAGQIYSGTFGAGDYIFSGVVTATNFSGDGSSITNVKAPWSEITGMPAGFSDGTDDSDTLWDQSGSIIYYNGGDVGIGDATPDAKFDVEMGSGESIILGTSSTTATGTRAIAIGHSNHADGSYAVAIGTITNASGYAATTMGRETVASSSYTTAMGYQSEANASYATAMNYRTKAAGQYSTAMGQDTTASGGGAVSMGYNTIASGAYSLAKGHTSTASASLSTVFGREMDVSGTYSMGISLNDPGSPYQLTDNSVMSIMGGNVGIGTVSPENSLHVVGGHVATDHYLIVNAYESDSGSSSYNTSTQKWSAWYDGRTGYDYLDTNSGMKIGGDLRVGTLTGSGNAYACIDSNGKIYRSATACA